MRADGINYEDPGMTERLHHRADRLVRAPETPVRATRLFRELSTISGVVLHKNYLGVALIQILDITALYEAELSEQFFHRFIGGICRREQFCGPALGLQGAEDGGTDAMTALRVPHHDEGDECVSKERKVKNTIPQHHRRIASFRGDPALAGSDSLRNERSAHWFSLGD